MNARGRRADLKPPRPLIAPAALYQEVAARLRERIFAHEFPPGAWIDEQTNADPSVLVSRPYAEHYYPYGNAAGALLTVVGGDQNGIAVTIAGVVDVRHHVNLERATKQV